MPLCKFSIHISIYIYLIIDICKRILLQSGHQHHLRLHQVLEQLYTALKAWEGSVKASTTLTGSFQPDRDYRQDERAVNVASIAFEEFHAKLGDVEINLCITLTWCFVLMARWQWFNMRVCRLELRNKIPHSETQNPAKAVGYCRIVYVTG